MGQLAKNKAAEEAIKAMVIKEKDSGPDAAPWSALACLGLYKVFTEWESQGVALEHLFTTVMKPVHHQEEEKPNAIPTIITTLGPPEPQVTRDRKQRSGKKKDGPKVAGKMPADPTSRHPVQLLNELHPGLDFRFFVGGENNYDCRVRVEEMDFNAKGKKNKKEAKKHAALEALRVLYNVITRLDPSLGEFIPVLSGNCLTTVVTETLKVAFYILLCYLLPFHWFRHLIKFDT